MKINGEAKLSIKDIIILIVGEKPISRLHLKYEAFVACRVFGIDATPEEIERAINELEKEGLIEQVCEKHKRG
ncbi:MAG: hypothetical protein DRZ82_09865 [Thermoprotei archaeon]|nr:MAG: hypothetical protein DRZ82_09865 [Thermoprotei archaeon]